MPFRLSAHLDHSPGCQAEDKACNPGPFRDKEEATKMVKIYIISAGTISYLMNTNIPQNFIFIYSMFKKFTGSINLDINLVVLGKV